MPSPYRTEPRAAPDPFEAPHLYEGILTRRLLGYGIDVLILAALAVVVWLVTGALAILTLGLLAPLQALALALLPFAYHILLIGGRASATIGMRVMGVEVRRTVDGGRPDLIQAAINVVVFYGSIALTGALILLLALFNPRRRTLHDYLAGTVVLRRQGITPS